jgi:hypothetical protein
MTFEAAIKQAEGYADLNMWQEAWKILVDLSEEDSNRPEPLRVGIKVAAMVGFPHVAHEIAQTLRHGDDEDRYQAACWYQALAASEAEQGRTELARELLSEALAIRPQHREVFQLEPRIAGLY